MTPRNKNITLVILIIFVSIVAYKYAISNTLELKDRISQVKRSLNNSDKKSRSSNILKRENAYLDSIIAKNDIKFSSVQNQLLAVLNKHSDSLNYNITSFKKPHEYVNKTNEKFISFTFKLEGNYKDLERILFIIENNYSLGRLVHTSFQVETNYRTQRKKLLADVIFTYIKKKITPEK